MLTVIKAKVERELVHFAEAFRRPPLDAIPGPFAEIIEQYIRRDGKRLRSVLFVLGYQGYTQRQPRHLYRSAAALELLHDFILVHDDLIDRASLRRGGAAMHTAMDALLNGTRGLRFKGQDLALIVGDMLYAMAIEGFLAVAEDPARKQKALALLTQTAVFTGCGELDELLHTLRPLADVTPEAIYRIYDWKTGHYTFASPLSMGATLGGAKPRDVRRLTEIGIALGRAFQIRDDLLDLYGAGDRYGKPALHDLREGKKTLPVWYAYRHCTPADQRRMEQVLGRPGASDADIRAVAAILDASGAAEFALGEMERLKTEALALLSATAMRATHRQLLMAYTASLLAPPVRESIAVVLPPVVGPLRSQRAVGRVR